MYITVKLSTLVLIVTQIHTTDKGKYYFLSQTRHANVPHKVRAFTYIRQGNANLYKQTDVNVQKSCSNLNKSIYV